MKEIHLQILKHFESAYGLDASLSYFAGGHEWSDGTIYSGYISGREVLLKVIAYQDEKELSIHRKLLYYGKYLFSRGLCTPEIITTVDDDLISVYIFEGKVYICFAWEKIIASVIKLADPVSCNEFYIRWAKLLSAMHSMSSGFNEFYNRQKHKDSSAKLSIEQEWQFFHHFIPDNEVALSWDKLCDKLRALKRTPQNFGIIHNDLHPGNLLEKGTELCVLDFEVANYAWFVQDIAICIYSECARVDNSPYKDFLPRMNECFITPFLTAYFEYSPLDKSETEHIPLFLQYRKHIMFAVFYDQIKSAAPHHLQKMKRELIEDDPVLDPRWFT